MINLKLVDESSFQAVLDLKISEKVIMDSPLLICFLGGGVRLAAARVRSGLAMTLFFTRSAADDGRVG